MRPSNNVRALRILIVDDQSDAAESMGELLRNYGHECRAFTNGAAALEKIVAFQPNVCLLDIVMPQMTGWTLAPKICAALGYSPTLIAVTGRDQPLDLVTTKAFAFHAHFVKPVVIEHLLKYLEANVTSPSETELRTGAT